MTAMPSYAPGQVPTPLSLVSDRDLTEATDAQLSHTAYALRTESHRRALEGGDLEALVEQAFLDGFTSANQACAPVVVDGFLICYGTHRARSQTSHDCTFVSINGQWVWEASPLADVMRTVPGAKPVRMSVSVLVAEEGTEVDLVSSTARQGGGCQMKEVHSYQVVLGELVQVATRARAAASGHRS